VQAPAAHEKDSTSFDEHARPQAPQLFGSLEGSASHPVSALPSQSSQPLRQEATTHFPATQDDWVFGTRHESPQPPQCSGADARFVSQPSAGEPLQSPVPGAHEVEHTPAEHDGIPPASEQITPQVPQFCTLVSRLVSHPGASGSQSPNPLSHLMAQTPSLHEATPLTSLQDVLHAPQFAVELSRSVSQPLATSPSQSPHPLEHTLEHAPPTHAATALGLGTHGVAHEPQCSTLDDVLVSQPFDSLPSQSP